MAKKTATAAAFGAQLNKVVSTLGSDTFHVGFSNLDMWASTGNYALNRLLSNQYDRAFLYGRSIAVYGESGSGKSLLLAQCAGFEQKMRNAYVIWVDAESATDDKAGEEWFRRAGVDTKNNFMYTSFPTMGEAMAMIAKIASQYRKALKDGEEIQPLVVFFDSYSALLTETQFEQGEEGKMVGDQGQKAKQTGEFILKTNHLLRGLPVLVGGVLHVYDNQEKSPQGFPIGGKHKLTGGNKTVYLASQTLLLTKKELKKEDVEDKKAIASDVEDKKVVGITSVAKVLKSRYSKPFETVDIQIPYNTGIDPYSGLFNLFLLDGVITSPSNGWYAYKDAAGKEVKFQRKNFRAHADFLMGKAPSAAPDAGVDLVTPEPGEAEPEEE
jgi:RecA/RadA recombinase